MTSKPIADRSEQSKLIADRLQPKPICPHCGKVYVKNGLAYSRHLETHKNGGDNCKCDICGKVLSDKYSLKTHMKVHDEKREKFECSQCDILFTNAYYRNAHEKKHHMIKKPKKTYIPPTDFHQCLKPKYIIYVKKHDRIIRCLGVYRNLEEASQHTGCGKDMLQNLYLDNNRNTTISKVLIMQHLPPTDLYYRSKNQKTISFD